MQHAIGWSSFQVPSRTLATKLCGWRVERGLPSPEHTAPNFSVTDCDMYIERKLSLSSIGSIVHVYIEEEEWEFIFRDVIDGKESETECTTNLRGHFLEFEVCRGNARSDSSTDRKSEASILPEFTINPPRNWWMNHR